MKFQTCLIVIFLNFKFHAWCLFSQKHYKYNKSKYNKSKLKLAKSSIEEIEVFKKNSTNHTFLDEEEYMKLLRFYRPI
tara:strand:- start:657 stop:890 length:234 start_codon:yes stop_codon:yes gene_type:complete